MKPPILPIVVIITTALLPALIAITSLPFNIFGVGLLLAWLGTGLISASLLLMVREPAWAGWFGGLQRMYQWHHVTGVVGYALLLMHPLFLASHYLVLDPNIAWNYLSPFNPHLSNLLGWSALIAFMLGLAATFILRLPYSLWRHLHLLLAVAMILALGHVWLAGGFSVSLAAALLPAIIATGWRLLRTDYGIGSRPYEVSEVRHPTEQITELILRPLATPMLIAQGQFVSAAFFEGSNFHGCGEFHPYTVSHITKNNNIILTIKALGDCTQHIQSLEPGVAVRLQGPYGDFLLNRKNSPEIWLAAGIGITPFLAILRKHSVTQHTEIIYIHRENKNVPYENELQSTADKQKLIHFKSLAMTNDPTPLLNWLSNITKLNERQVYLCGPPPLIKLISHWLQERGVPRQQIHFEQFDFR